MTEKESFLNIWKQEFAITKKLIEHYPADKADLKPAAICRSAKELIGVFVQAHGLLEAALRGRLDMGAFPEPAGTIPELLVQFEEGFKKDYEQVKAMPQEDWDGLMDFMGGPGKFVRVRRAEILWLVVHDWIHHRGQLSIYMRVAGAKVPSIYGPSADEPWM